MTINLNILAVVRTFNSKCVVIIFSLPFLRFWRLVIVRDRVFAFFLRFWCLSRYFPGHPAVHSLRGGFSILLSILYFHSILLSLPWSVRAVSLLCCPFFLLLVFRTYRLLCCSGCSGTRRFIGCSGCSVLGFKFNHSFFMIWLIIWFFGSDLTIWKRKTTRIYSKNTSLIFI